MNRLTVEVRNFGMVENATVEIDGVTLLAGKNDQGKSTIADAARFAISGALPIGMTKKDAAILVRAGEKAGAVAVSGPDGSASVSYPKAEAATKGAPPRAGGTALGLIDYLALDDKGRARLLADLLRTTPDKQDLAADLPDHSAEEVDAIWDAIDRSGGNIGGWDAVHAKTKEEGTVLKRDWCTATGNKAWGSEVGANYEPDGWAIDLVDDGITRASLIEDVDIAREALKQLEIAGAVSEATLANLKEWGPDRLEKLRPGLAQLEADEKKTKAAVDKIKAEIAALPQVSSYDEYTSHCPHCDGRIAVYPSGKNDGHYDLRKPTPELPPEEIKRIKTEKAALIQRQDRAQRPYEAAARAANAHRDAIKVAEDNNAKYEAALAAQRSAEDTETERAQANERVERAQKRLRAWVAKTKADEIHRAILRNLQVQAALADDGVRRKKLVRVLDHFNDTVLDGLTKAGGWKPIRIEPDLWPSYGGRSARHRLCRSALWRVGACLRAAFAKVSKADLMVLDDADILVSGAHRGGLMKLLRATGVPVLVCMAVPTPDKVPDLAQGGGRSYWVEGGRVVPIAEAKAAHEAAQQQKAA